MSNLRMATKYVLAVLGVAAGLAAGGVAQAQLLRVCATVPELGSLAEEVGGDRVAVTVFTKGTESPHYTVPKPSFIKALSTCHAYVQTGMELEAGWASGLLQNARNAAILPGAPGYIDASAAVDPMQVPTGPVDRAQGDIHPSGNPHYLLDPMNGLRVAGLLRDRLTVLRPEDREHFAARYADFRRRLGVALVGAALFERYDFEKLATLARHRRLNAFLDRQGQADLIGGWLGVMRPHVGAKLVADHNVWPYFATLFGLDVIGFLEPLPGIPPTTKHLGVIVGRMRVEQVRALLTVAYYDPRYAQFVSEETGAAVVQMANQAGARPGTADYLAMVDYNVTRLAAVLGGAV